MLPVFAPLKLTYDPQPIIQELQAYEPNFRVGCTLRYNLDLWRNSKLNPATPFHYDNVEILDDAGFHDNYFKSWRILDLTTSSKDGGLFHGHHWRSDLLIPETRRLISRLPIMNLGLVEVLTIAPPGFGPAHKDSLDRDPNPAFRQLYFLLDDGGVPLKFLDRDGDIHERNDLAFTFQDCFPHAVPVVKHQRWLLKIRCTVYPFELERLIDKNDSIF
jgi:hypothetical protein